MDTRSDDFDPRSLRALIESRIDRIAWPRLEINPPDLDKAFSGFSISEARSSSEMAALRRQLEELANTLLRNLVEQVDQAVHQVCKELDALAEQMHEALTQSLREEIERLRLAYDDKAKKMEQLQALVAIIEAELNSGSARAIGSEATQLDMGSLRRMELGKVG